MSHCPICQASFKSDIPENCPICGTVLGDTAAEVLVKTVENAAYIPSEKQFTPNVKVGTLLLTNQRLLFSDTLTADIVAQSTGKLLGKAIGEKIGSKVANKLKLDVALSEIKEIGLAKQGLFGKCILLRLNSGTAFKLEAKPREEWVTALEKAMGK